MEKLQGSSNTFYIGGSSQDIAQDRVLSLLKSKKRAFTKFRLISICGLSNHAVSFALRNLRKKGVIGLYYKKYWGLK